MTRRVSLPFFLLLAALWSMPARADVSDADRATARSLTVEGYDALDRKDYVTAADRFERADSLYHVPTVTLGLARAQVGLGHLVSALATYSRIVREGTPAGGPAAFAKAVDDARRELDALSPRVPGLVLKVTGAPTPTVTIDGAPVPAAALGVRRPVDPGARVVRATADGYLPAEATVSVQEGKVEEVALTLVVDPNASKVSVPPVAATPSTSPSSSPGPAQSPGPRASGDTTGDGAGQRRLAYISLGLGGAGLAFGAVTGGLALSKHGSLSESCPDGHCPRGQESTLQSDIDSYHTLGTLSTVGFIAGGIAASAGLVLLLSAPSESGEQMAILPVLAPGYIGTQGSF